MRPVTIRHVEVYLFRRHRGRTEFLALRRSKDRAKLPGVWQPVTGRIDGGERALEAAVREVREETGLSPRRWWALESVSVFYDSNEDQVYALPLFAAEVGPADRVTLSEEHDAWAFLAAATAARRWLWNAQRRALAAVREEVLRPGRLSRALEVKPGSGRPPRRRAAAAGARDRKQR